MPGEPIHAAVGGRLPPGAIAPVGMALTDLQLRRRYVDNRHEHVKRVACGSCCVGLSRRARLSERATSHSLVLRVRGDWGEASDRIAAAASSVSGIDVGCAVLG